MPVKERIRKHRAVAKGFSWKRASPAYLALVREFPIRPLASDDELDDAIRMLDNLLCRPQPLHPQEKGYLDSLAHEIHRYESAAVPMPEVSGAAMLKHLMEARETTLSEVAADTGIAVSTLSAVLAQKRTLNLAHIKALAPYFGVEPNVFI